MNNPKVSIIIPVYNGANYMSEAIDSALAQSYDNCEVIVVNDGSTDDGATDAIARSYGDRIRYFIKENGGVATAFNYGIERMNGEYFSWLSHDDIYKPDKVKHQMECFSTLPFDTILYSGYETFFDKSIFKAKVRFEKKYADDELETPLFPVFRGLANGCTILFHRSHFERVGVFKPELRTTQDYDLWFRMFRDAKVHYCGFTDVLIRQHDNQGSKVLPNHLEEANKLWIWMSDNVTDVEKCKISGTPYLFYKTLYEFLLNTPYNEATAYIKKLSDEAKFDAVPDGDGDEKNKIICAMASKYEILEEKYSKLSKSKMKLFNLQTLNQARIMIKNEGFSTTLKRAIRFITKKE